MFSESRVEQLLFYLTRNWLAQRDLFLCQWKFFVGKFDFGTLLWGREESRLFSEIFPHCIQCVLILSMAVERYILVCLPTRASSLLSRKRRQLFYIIITLTLFLLGALFLAAYRTGFMYSDKEKFQRSTLHEMLNVGNQVISNKATMSKFSAPEQF